MIFRMRYESGGSHVHVRVFQALNPSTTFALCGTLVFDLASWALFAERMRMARVEVLPDTIDQTP